LPPGPIVGFFGLLSEWVDQDLLVALARSLRTEIQQSMETGPLSSAKGSADDCNAPDISSKPTSRIPNPESRIPNPESRITRCEASIVLIGQADVDVSRLRAEPNIVLPGPKPFAELPDYIRHFDVGVIPFVVNELTVAVNPIKLREMLAAGCPVVSTALPEVERYASADGGESSTTKHAKDAKAAMRGCPSAVRISHSSEEFVAHVRAALRDPPGVGERRAISAGMAGETWAAKVDEILAAISRKV